MTENISPTLKKLTHDTSVSSSQYNVRDSSTADTEDILISYVPFKTPPLPRLAGRNNLLEVYDLDNDIETPCSKATVCDASEF